MTMKIPTRARYSIRLMIYLADHADEKKPISLSQVAEKQGLSIRYLESLIVSLKNASLVKSVAGKYGGYLLTKDPKDISVGKIVEVAIGPIKLMDCLDTDTSCQFKEICASRRMWGLINTRITDVLYDYTLNDLSEKKTRETRSGKTEGKEGKPLPC